MHVYRKEGAIPTIKQSRYPHSFMVFDTEAYRSEPINGVEYQTFRLAVCRMIYLAENLDIYKDDWRICNTPEALYGYIDQQTRKDKCLYIYAHNIKYDLQLSNLLMELMKHDWNINQFVIDDPPTYIKLSKNRSSIMFVDTFNYWQTSVEAMGYQLGLSKMDMPDSEANYLAWQEYCKRDVEVLSEYIIEFVRFLITNDLAPLGLTLASQAFRSYRHRFMPDGIIIHNDKQALSLERAAYSGGRVEAFFIGEKLGQIFTKLDVNSMYPFVMHKQRAPVELVSYGENIPLIRLEKLLQRYYCIAEVVLWTDEPVYPYKDLHKLVFPIEGIITTLHQQELEYAISHNHILAVNSLAIYQTDMIFDEYVKFFYQLKQTSELTHDMITRHQAKILMNSLYGKFGQRNNVSKIYDNPGEYEYGRLTGYSEQLKRNVAVNYLGKQIEVSYSEGESAYSFPAIAGSVTANARMYLWSLMQQAEENNVFYVDTDSLMTNLEGLFNLESYLNDTELGALKIEDTALSFIINGAKDYTFGDVTKHKGVPHKAVKIGDNLWEYDQFRGMLTWLREGMPTGVTITRRHKQRIGTYDKGVIQIDGRVRPLSFVGWGD